MTIRNIKQIFSDIATNSIMINDYFFGNDYHKNGVQPKYPLLQVYCTSQALNTELSRNIIKSSDVEIVVWDRIDKGDDNFDHITSDTSFVLESIIVSLRNHPLYKSLYISSSKSFDYDLILEAGKDNIIGWRGVITLSSPLNMTLCNIPLTNVSIDC